MLLTVSYQLLLCRRAICTDFLLPTERLSMISRSAYLKETLFFDQKKKNIGVFSEAFCLGQHCVRLWSNQCKMHLHFCQSISCLRSCKSAWGPRENAKHEVIDSRADSFYHLLLDITACGCGRKVAAICNLSPFSLC